MKSNFRISSIHIKVYNIIKRHPLRDTSHTHFLHDMCRLTVQILISYAKTPFLYSLVSAGYLQINSFFTYQNHKHVNFEHFFKTSSIKIFFIFYLLNHIHIRKILSGVSMRFLSSHKRLTFILFFLCILFPVFFVLFGIHTVSPIENESYRTGLLEKMEHASTFSQFTNALFCYEVTNDSITTAYTLKTLPIMKFRNFLPDLLRFPIRNMNRIEKISPVLKC